MKVLWICNMMFPEAAKHLDIQSSFGGGWMVSLANGINRTGEAELFICSVYSGNAIKEATLNNIKYIAIPSENLEESWKKVISMVRPDVIHVHGTEYGHGEKVMRLCPDENYVVSIQGLVSVYAHHYTANLPGTTINSWTLRDIIKRSNIKTSQKDFQRRGKSEVEILKMTKNVIGRTEWDKACTYEINPNAKYYHCNELLRTAFYENKWKSQNCEKYSIFMSQGSYPIKGLHMVLRAMPQIIKEFPKVHLYIAGTKITDTSSLKAKLKLTTYGKYIVKLIKKLKVEEHVTFLGGLNEKEMCERLISSNVFLSSSAIENSPNSLGEAMLTGVPCISSDVGGVVDMMTHKVEGYIYPYDEFYMIPHYVRKIFNEQETAVRISKAARIKAEVTHNVITNVEATLNIYKNINNGDKEVED